MSELAFRESISLLFRELRPQTFRRADPRKLCRRSYTHAAPVGTQLGHHDKLPWQSHGTSHKSSYPVPETRLSRLRSEPDAPPLSSFLTDNFARTHTYLRISVTERCNLRCLYCMPEEGVQLSPQAHLLTTPEIVYLSSLFVNQGVNKIRLTGGEPTVRKDIVPLMRQIGELRRDGLKELCLTTNGISLYRKLDDMVEAGLTGINLSLDTLDPFQFTLMTRRNGHEAVMRSIKRILEMNRQGARIKLKINCVIMRGMNEREIVPFVELGREQDLEVRFIEYMPFDGNKWSQNKMMGFKEMLATIQHEFPDVYKVQDHANDTSKTYKVPGFAGRVGFITSMTNNFCGTCNRLRITGDGNLKVCLFGNAEVSLRDILRESNDRKPIDEAAMKVIRLLEERRGDVHAAGTDAIPVSAVEQRLLDVIGMAVKRKKAKHAGMGELEKMKNRPMILIAEPSHSQTPARLATPALAHPTSGRPSLQGSRSRFGNAPIPVHLLLSNSNQTQYAKLFSTSPRLLLASYREVLTQGTHRPIPTALPALDSGDDDRHISLSHLDPSGNAHMVSITDKKSTLRSATATCQVYFSNTAPYTALKTSTLSKGDALAVARVAGIMAAKKTADLIPLAHSGLGLTGVTVKASLFSKTLKPDYDGPDGAPGIDDKVERPDTNSKSASAGFELASIAQTSRKVAYGVQITATVKCEGKTGVEMEALTAASVAGLTIYDMCKGLDKGMVMSSVRVIRKTGGKSGDWIWDFKHKKVRRSTPRRWASKPIEKDESEDYEINESHSAIADETTRGSELAGLSFEQLLELDDPTFDAAAQQVGLELKRAREAMEPLRAARVVRRHGKIAGRVGSDGTLLERAGHIGQAEMVAVRMERQKRFEASTPGTLLVDRMSNGAASAQSSEKQGVQMRE